MPPPSWPGSVHAIRNSVPENYVSHEHATFCKSLSDGGREFAERRHGGNLDKLQGRADVARVNEIVQDARHARAVFATHSEACKRTQRE